VAGVPLVTGATGFAGRYLVERLLSRGGSVSAWAHRGGTAAAAAVGVNWHAVDLLDRDAVRDGVAAARPSVIYHCAGFADVHDAWRAPARALRVNAIGTHNLLEAVRQAGLSCRVLVTGSAMVYRPSADSLSEDSPIGPAGPYGVSKLAQEMTADASPLPVLLVRPFNHAGPGQSPAYATSAFAQQVAEIEAGSRQAVLRVGNLDARRDITDVRDTVRAYEALAERGRTHLPYNVCSGRPRRMRELLDILISLAHVRVRIELDESRLRPSDNPVIAGSHERLTRDTGWEPQIPIEQTLSDLLDHWRLVTAGQRS
jgi:GDP-4-dehydro-6-deoxy-D-mannose reductase